MYISPRILLKELRKSTLIFFSNCHDDGQTIENELQPPQCFSSDHTFSSRHYISLRCDVTLSTSIKLLDKLTLQIRSLLCVSLAEVQGNGPIFMEIRDNIHQLSFTSFIFISFLILTLSARLHCQQDSEECFGLLRLVRVSDLCYENFIKHTHSELEGQANFI